MPANRFRMFIQSQTLQDPRTSNAKAMHRKPRYSFPYPTHAAHIGEDASHPQGAYPIEINDETISATPPTTETMKGYTAGSTIRNSA